MFVKKVVDLCKKAGYVYMFEDADGFQWLSDTVAMYPMDGMPYFNEPAFCEVFDITGKAADKIHMQFKMEIPGSLNFADSIADEKQVDYMDFTINYGGKKLLPILTSAGMQFIELKYFSPLKDVDMRELFIYERHQSADAPMYFAVKLGLEVVAIIFPANIITEEFADKLALLAEQTQTAVCVNKEREQK